VREICTPGSDRGAGGDSRPYRTHYPAGPGRCSPTEASRLARRPWRSACRASGARLVWSSPPRSPLPRRTPGRPRWAPGWAGGPRITMAPYSPEIGGILGGTLRRRALVLAGLRAGGPLEQESSCLVRCGAARWAASRMRGLAAGGQHKRGSAVRCARGEEPSHAALRMGSRARLVDNDTVNLLAQSSRKCSPLMRGPWSIKAHADGTPGCRSSSHFAHASASASSVSSGTDAEDALHVVTPDR